MIDRLGPNKVAELLVNGRKKFVDNLQSMPEDARANVEQELSGAQYKERMEEAMGRALAEDEGEEEECIDEGEEEDLQIDAEEAEECPTGDAEGTTEPSSKKQKNL
mmetsp:Transcript_8246/g.13483  ORF Transcript_8246/g.13483 Transcript_8246/m.13483 type:complete len:106 (-) Transcript_8246:10-327(-)